jgi:hypothetical protein
MNNKCDPDFEVNCNTTIEELFGEDKRSRAVELAKLGFPVFPINEYIQPADLTAGAVKQAEKKAKTPLSGFSQKQAHADPELVRRMWSAPDGSPANYNIGLAITDDFFVLDVDSDKGGDVSLQQLELKHGPLPPTVTVKTRSGGTHYYFRTEGREVKNSVGKVGKGIDVRGAESHGYVLAPGSEINGKSYEWVMAPRCNALDSMAEPPSWLIDLMPTGARAERDTMAAKPLCALDQGHNLELAWRLIRETEPAIEGAGGREQTMQLSRELHDLAISPDKQLELLTEPFVKAGEAEALSWNERCLPPWSLSPDCAREDDLEYLLQESWRSCRSRPGCKTEEGRAAQAQEEFERVKLEGESHWQAEARRIVQMSAEFVAGFVPPDYLIEGLLQRRFLYSLTAATGGGKTAQALLLTAHVALGQNLGGREVAKGSVLYFAGENPDDIRMRWFAQTQQFGLTPEDFTNVYFVPGVYKLSEIGDRIRHELAHIDDLALIIVDTSAAYYEGDDENNNVQAGDHARRLRRLVQFNGGPTVLVCCHPVKNAGADNLLPRGGGAFLNEVDGNLTSKRDDTVTELHWAGKFRGPEFAPMTFQLRTVTHERLKDSKGRTIPVVICEPISEERRQEMKARSNRDADEVLLSIGENAGISQRERAMRLGWYMNNDQPYQMRVNRAEQRLIQDGAIRRGRTGWKLTDHGRKDLARLKKADVSKTAGNAA